MSSDSEDSDDYDEDYSGDEEYGGDFDLSPPQQRAIDERREERREERRASRRVRPAAMADVRASIAAADAAAGAGGSGATSRVRSGLSASPLGADSSGVGASSPSPTTASANVESTGAAAAADAAQDSPSASSSASPVANTKQSTADGDGDGESVSPSSSVAAGVPAGGSDDAAADDDANEGSLSPTQATTPKGDSSRRARSTSVNSSRKKSRDKDGGSSTSSSSSSSSSNTAAANLAKDGGKSSSSRKKSTSSSSSSSSSSPSSLSKSKEISLPQSASLPSVPSLDMATRTSRDNAVLLSPMSARTRPVASSSSSLSRSNDGEPRGRRNSISTPEAPTSPRAKRSKAATPQGILSPGRSRRDKASSPRSESPLAGPNDPPFLERFCTDALSLVLLISDVPLEDRTRIMQEVKSARLRAVTKKLTVRTAHIDLTGIKEQSPVQRPQPLSVWEDWAAFSEQQYAALVRVHSNTRRLMLHQKRIRATVVLQSFARMWLVRAPMVNKIDTPAKRAQLLRFNSSLTDLYKKESQYASALENVIGNYQLPLRIQSHSFGFKTEDEVLLFGNIDALLKIHRTISLALDRLLPRWPFSTGVGKVYLEMQPAMEAYEKYVSNFRNAQSTLARLKTEIPSFVEFLQQVDTANGMNFSSLLSQPINHIAKISSLVLALSESTFCEDDKAQLIQAYKMLNATGKLITKGLIEGDNREELANVQRRIKGCENLVKPNRTFVMEGAVTLVTVDETTSSSNVLSPRVAPAKVKEKDKPLQNAPCRLFHFSDLLLVTLPEKAAKKSGKSSSSTPEFKALESFALESVRVVPDSADARVFQIVNPKQTFVFQASTTTDKESWVNSLLLHIEMASRYKLFGVPLKKILLLEKRPFGVPSILEACTEHIREEDPQFTTVGLFRVSGEQSELEKLKTEFDTHPPDDYNLLPYSIHVVAGTLKLWFRELPEPLLTYELYDKFISAQRNADGEAASPETLRDLVLMLPDENYRTLKFLIRFLFEVCQQSEVNKMTPSNMSIVFGPTLLAPAVFSLESSLNSTFVSQTVESMIEYHDVVFSSSK